VTLFFLFFALWTCIQRVVFKRHYVDQIIVGALVGFMLAYYSYKLSLALVEEKDKMYV
jgi:membrane-associated phospholipid phosphatase